MATKEQLLREFRNNTFYAPFIEGPIMSITVKGLLNAMGTIDEINASGAFQVEGSKNNDGYWTIYFKQIT